MFYIGSGENHEGLLMIGVATIFLTIEVSDGEYTDSYTFGVDIENVNDAPEFSQDSYNFILNENVSGSSTPVPLGNVSATDEDAGDTLTYSIASGDTDKFNISSESGEITYIGQGEDGSTPVYSLNISVNDTGQLSARTTVQITINATTVNTNNAPQFNQTSYTFSLSENRDGSTTPISLGFVNATDDDGDPLTYSITSGNADNKFNIDETTGEITYIGSGEDYEDTSGYQLIANVDDGTILSDGILVTINILDVEEAPVFRKEHFSNEVPENMNNVWLFSNIATDPEGGSLTYSITEGDASKFSVSSGNVHYVGGGEDYESLTANGGADHYNFTVQVSDGSFNVSANFTVTILDVNEAPKTDTPSYFGTLDENVGGNRGIAFVSVTDPENDDLNYSIISGNTSKFSINEDGDLSYIGRGEDYEDLIATTGSDNYELVIEFSDGEYNDSYEFTLYIANVNEAPEFIQDSYNFILNENVSGSSTPVPLGNVSATDEDTGDTLTYSITSGNTSKFHINSTTGALTYIGQGEDGTTPVYSLNISVNDTGHLSDQTTVQIRINTTANINTPPSFMEILRTATLGEDKVGSTVSVFLGLVSATDFDNDNLTYSITEGDTSKFRVDTVNNEGKLYYIGSGEDYETGPGSYNLTIEVSDGTDSASLPFTINIVNVNEPPEAQGGSHSNDIDENVGGNQHIGAVSVTDPENDDLNYSITQGNTSKFSIDDNGLLYYIGRGEDYEDLIATTGSDNYELIIEVSDGEFNISYMFTLYIGNVNEAPEFLQDSYNFLLNENTSGSSTPVPVGTVTATDEDTGDTLEYSITSGDTDKFNISSESGALTYIGSGEDGSTPSYSLNVSVQDAEFSVQTSVQVTVNTTDNTISPNIPPSFTELSHLSLDENIDGGTPFYIGNATATDQDNDTLTYSITEGNTNKFNINSETGEITYIGSGENYESETKQYNLTIQVTDNSWNVAGNITVSIVDVNDPPAFDDDSHTFTLNSNSTLVNIGTVSATDEDTGDTLEYSITSGNSGNKFNISESTGEITYIGSGEDGSTPQYHLNVRVSDSVSASDSTDVYININPDDTVTQLGPETYLNICGRSWWVRNKILQRTPSNDNCDRVALSEMAAITELDFNGYGDAHMQVGDFDNMTGLLRLDLSDIDIGLIHNEDGSHPNSKGKGYTDNLGGLFRDLTNLEYLSLRNNRLRPGLPDDSFKNLGNLRELDVRGYSKTPGGRTGAIPGGKSLGACWSFEEKARIHPDYPWDPRKNSPNAFRPLTSLETYNFDKDFNTENIYSVGSEIPIFSTNITITQISQYDFAYRADIENSSIDNDTFRVDSDDYVIEYFSLQFYTGYAVLRFNKPLSNKIIGTGGIRINNDEIKYFVEGDIWHSGREIRFDDLKSRGNAYELNGTAALFTVVLRPFESQYDYEPAPYATNNYVQPPASPRNVAVSENDKVFTITWDAPEDVTVTHYRIERGLNPGSHQAEKRRAGIIPSAGPNVQCTDSYSSMITDYSRFANYVNTVDANQNSYADDLSGKLPLGHYSISSLHYHVYAITEDGESMPVSVRAR